MNRTREATECYCKVITLRPKHREARRLLALAHCVIGDVDEAVRIFDEWLAEEPGDPIALHMRAACKGRDVPARASNGFVERTFDCFASSFEAKLEQLFYRAPSLAAAMLEYSSLEHAVGAASHIDWQLELHGRYSHARSYVERVLTAFGLQPWIVPAQLRMESGVPVAGLVVRGMKAIVRPTGSTFPPRPLVLA